MALLSFTLGWEITQNNLKIKVFQAGDKAWLTECLPNIEEVDLSTTAPGVAACSCDAGTQQAEKKGSEGR